jgi:hypothetical protein
MWCGYRCLVNSDPLWPLPSPQLPDQVFLPFGTFIPLRSGKGIPQRYKWYTASYRSNSNSKSKSPVQTVPSGIPRYKWFIPRYKGFLPRGKQFIPSGLEEMKILAWCWHKLVLNSTPNQWFTVIHRNTTPNTIILAVHKWVDSSNTNSSYKLVHTNSSYDTSSLVERKDPQLGRGVVLGWTWHSSLSS